MTVKLVVQKILQIGMLNLLLYCDLSQSLIIIQHPERLKKLFPAKNGLPEGTI